MAGEVRIGPHINNTIAAPVRIPNKGNLLRGEISQKVVLTKAMESALAGGHQ